MNALLRKAPADLCAMPSVAEGSALARISPLPKVAFCMAFLALAVSFGRYRLWACLAYAAFPFLLARLGRLPAGRLFARACAALPFVLCAGIANCFLDRAPVELAPGFRLEGGFVSLIVLFAKTLATVGMVQALAYSTPMSGIAGALRRLRVPCILILQLQLLFRYLSLLLQEARSVTDAYFLRSPACRAIPLRDWGALVGRLFLRSVERANAIYQAMECRLFHAGDPLPASASGRPAEWIGALLLISFFAFLRIRA